MNIDPDDDGAIAIVVQGTDNKWNIVVWVVDCDGRTGWQSQTEGFTREYDLILIQYPPVALPLNLRPEIKWAAMDENAEWAFYINRPNIEKK